MNGNRNKAILRNLIRIWVWFFIDGSYLVFSTLTKYKYFSGKYKNYNVKLLTLLIFFGVSSIFISKNTVRQVKAERIDTRLELRLKARIYVAKNGKEEFIHLNYMAVTAVLPEHSFMWYTLVIVKGFEQQPMLLLTNKQVNIHNNKQLWQITEIYLTRWKCHECYR